LREKSNGVLSKRYKGQRAQEKVVYFSYDGFDGRVGIICRCRGCFPTKGQCLHGAGFAPVGG
jgi:hypothetical protein